MLSPVGRSAYGKSRGCVDACKHAGVKVPGADDKAAVLGVADDGAAAVLEEFGLSVGLRNTNYLEKMRSGCAVFS